MIFVVSREARVEARKAAAWYDAQTMGVGSRFQDELAKVYQFIQAHPGAGSRVRLRGTKAVVRKRNLKTFPYAVVYQLIPPGVLVVAVSHAKRKQNYWRRRLLP